MEDPGYGSGRLIFRAGRDHNPEVHGSNPCPATNQSLEIVRFLGFLFSSCPTLERGFGQILDILSSTLALLALFLAICT